MTFSNRANGNSIFTEDTNAISKEIEYNKGKIKNLEELLFFDLVETHVGKYTCTNDGFLGMFLRYLFFLPFIGILRVKYFIYRHILIGLLHLIHFSKLHNLVTEDYYIHKINAFVLNSTTLNKFFLGNIFGFSLYGIIEILGIMLVSLVDALLIFFAKGLDFRGLYKIKYNLPFNTNMDLFFLEKNSNVFKGYDYFKTKDDIYNIVSAGRFLERENIRGLSKGKHLSGKLRYSASNQDESKKKVMLVNYYLNGLSIELNTKNIRVIKINSHYKIALVFETNTLKNQNDYADRNLILLENCVNFNNMGLLKNFEGLYFKN